MSIVIGMSVGHGAAREIERKLSGLKALYVHLEQEEGLADSAAFRTEERLKRLGAKRRMKIRTSLRLGIGWTLSHREATLDCA